MRAFTYSDRVAMSDPVFAERYRRAAAHDGHADGYFVTGIPMSEIFCRPGCATRTPRPTQVSFYPTAAAAHAAGLIPCPRCRPDMTCTAPDGLRGDTVASRALRLIADGEIERAGVDSVARRLGVTTRHVLRAVEAQAGCGPLGVARAARAHMSRLLLTATSMPIGAVAVAAGFTSVRQFNSTITRFYRTTPGVIRAGVRAAVNSRAVAASAQGPLVLRCALPVRQPFDDAGTFAFLTDQAIADVEDGRERWYARTVRLPHGAGHLRVDSDGRGGILATLSVLDPRDIAPLYSRVRRLLDADTDPIAIDTRLALDHALAPSVTARPGVRVPGSVDIEETVFRVLIGQQNSGFAARALLNRLARLLGEATQWGLLFPTADTIAEHARSTLTGPAARIDTVVEIARTIVAVRDSLHWGCSRAELVKALGAFRGMDASVIDRVIVRVFGAPDVLLAKDEDIRRGARQLGMPTDATALIRRGMLWSPWQSYAAMHLWHAARAA